MEEKKHYTAIVLAAGMGTRMKSDVPKQFMQLCGHPLVYYSLLAFEKSAVDDIVLVTGESERSYCQKEIVDRYGLAKVRSIVSGGSERYLSVYEGLKAAEGADYVLIHDGARPLVGEKEIADSMESVAREKACVIGTLVKDTIKVADEQEYAQATPQRSRLWAVQTPQSFSYDLLMHAYKEMFAQQEGESASVPITDDAMLVEQFTGHKVRLIHGRYENIKVTTPGDLQIAELFLKK